MNIHQIHSLRWRLTPQATVAAILLLLLAILHFGPRGDAQEWPRLERLHGHDVYWELPARAPSGVLLFAHGCNHAGGDLWPPSPRCPACKGLPVERRIRELALRRGLAVVAVSSAQATDLGAGCWDSAPGPGTDLALMPAILDAVRGGPEPALAGLPVYALGASSGGGFALLLPKSMRLEGIISQIMAAPASLLQDSLHPYPPTVFLHMPRDKRIAGAVAEDVATLAALKVPVAEGRVGPRAVTPAFLAQGSAGVIPRRLAAKIVAALTDDGFLDGEGMLQRDPRRHHAAWAAAVAPAVGDALSLEPDASPLTELLNVAWAAHEIVFTGVEAALEWVAGGGEGDFAAALAAEEAAERRGAGRRRRAAC